MTSSLTGRLAPWWIFTLIGAGGGFLAGLFGVGGGVLMMPLLVTFAGLTQRVATGTSLAVIVLTGASGSLSFALSGNVDWGAALIVALGAIGGAQLGSYLLSKLSENVLIWSFAAFQLSVIVSMWLVIPDRDAALGWSPLVGVLLFFLGIFTGLLAGLVGAGGGIVIVPALIVLFGVSDLVAKGTSLVMMIPGALSGTVANIRRQNIDLRGVGFTAIGAVTLAPLGAVMATAVSPQVGNILFTILIAVLAVTRLVSHVRRQRSR